MAGEDKNFQPPFFCQKMANEDVSLLFTLLCQQKLFTQNQRFSSHLHQTPEALLACPVIARRATADEDVPLR
jgi:hypothetical protein